MTVQRPDLKLYMHIPTASKVKQSAPADICEGQTQNVMLSTVNSGHVMSENQHRTISSQTT